MKVWKFYKGLSEKEAKNECRRIFIENYVRHKNGSRVLTKTKDGFCVYFDGGHQFWHAFTYKNDQSGVRRFSYQRARRILWIKKAIEECGGFKRKDEGKDRLYFHNNERYVVVLRKTKRGYRFITHYVLRDKKSFSSMCKRFK